MSTGRMAALLRDNEHSQLLIDELLKSAKHRETIIAQLSQDPGQAQALLTSLLKETDLVTCPITRTQIQHPVAASDGRIYEALGLADWFDQAGPVSPITREPIHSVAYLTLYKSDLLDKQPRAEDDADDYPDGIGPILERLKEKTLGVRTSMKEQTFKKRFSLVKSAYIATLAFATIYVGLEHFSKKGGFVRPDTNEFIPENTRAQNMNAAIAPSVLLAFFDYGLRVASNHMSGLPGTTYNAACWFGRKTHQALQRAGDYLFHSPLPF